MEKEHKCINCGEFSSVGETCAECYFFICEDCLYECFKQKGKIECSVCGHII